MTVLDVDGLQFHFPQGWNASRYDEWAFYRNQFCRIGNNIKAVDIVATDGRDTAWFIEVKDYRRHVRTKPTGLALEVVGKVLGTLAALLPAKVNASSPEEKQSAANLLRQRRLRVVLHLEQPAKPSRLFPRAIDPVSVLQDLERRLRPVDPHPLIVESAAMRGLAWRVE